MNLKILLKNIICLSICIIIFNGLPLTASAQNSENEIFVVAQKAFEDGFYDVSIRYLDQFLNSYPQTDKYVQANLLLGQCYFFKSQYLKAYEIFQGLLKYNEFKDATLYWLGETYLKGSDFSQAKSQYEQLIKLYPYSIYTPQAYYSLGWMLFDQGQYAEASDTFSKLVSLFPSHELNEDASFKQAECQYNLHNYDDAINAFKKFVEAFPKSRRHAESYFYVAESYYYLNNPLQAVTYYAKVADKAYDNKLIFMSKVSMGWSYLKLEKFDLSQQYFDEALSFAEGKGVLSDDVFLGQARLYFETQKYANALNSYFELIKKFPNSPRLPEAYLGIANVYYQLENYKEAVAAYQTIINQFTEKPDKEDLIEKAYFGLAWSYLKNKDIDASIKTFEKIKDKTKNQTVKISALSQIGDAYQDVDEFEKAIEIYDQILSDYPDSPYTDYVQYRQGIALLKMGKIEAATLSFQSLQANFPKSKYLNDIKYYLAVAYFKQNNWAAAKENILEFISNPNNERKELLAEAYYIQALSQYNLNEHNEAIKTFQLLMKNYPEQSEIFRNSELNIAKCHYQLKNTGEALKKFEVLSNKYPDLKIAQEALLWIGDHYLNASDFDNAISVYQSFLERFPGSEDINIVRYQLGQAFFAKEQFDQSLNILKTIDSRNREVYAKAQLAIADIFSKEIDQAQSLITYENIIKTSPEFKRDAYIKIAETYKTQREYIKALDAYKEALKTEKQLSSHENAELQFFIADTYELLNKENEAVEEYFKIPYLYPKQTEWIVKANLRIARIFENQEKWDEAKKVYKMILEYKTDVLKFAQERIEWIEENTKY